MIKARVDATRSGPPLASHSAPPSPRVCRPRTSARPIRRACLHGQQRSNRRLRRAATPLVALLRTEGGPEQAAAHRAKQLCIKISHHASVPNRARNCGVSSMWPCSDTCVIHGRLWLYSKTPLWMEACRPYGSAARNVSKSSSHTGDATSEGVGDRLCVTPRPLHWLRSHSLARLHHTLE